jgi:hypothetical protein
MSVLSGGGRDGRQKVWGGGDAAPFSFIRKNGGILTRARKSSVAGCGPPAPRHGGRWKAPRMAAHKVFVNENTKCAVVFMNGYTKCRLFAIHVANFCPVWQKKERFLGHFACIFVLDMVVSLPFVNENTNSTFQFVNGNMKTGQLQWIKNWRGCG